MIKQFAFSSALFVSFISTPLLAQPAIDRMAPENSVIIINAHNVQSTMEHVKNTGLWSLWQSDQVQALWADAQKQLSENLDALFQELGVEEDSLVPPTGAVGIAIYSVMNEELGLPEPAFMAVADYGDNADKTNNLIMAAIKRAEEEGRVEFEEQDVLGRTVYVIDLTNLQNQQGEDDDMGMGMGMNPMMPDPDEVFEGLSKLYYLRDGNTLMLASDLKGLTDGLEVVDGKAQPALAARTDYQTLSSKLGESDVQFVLLTRDVLDLFGSTDQGPMLKMMRPMIRTIFGRVDGYGLGVRVDGPKAMVEQTFAVYMPTGKQGLTALLDTPMPRNAPPAFVGPDTVSYSTFNFEFDGVMDLIRTVVNANPMLQGDPEMLEQIEPIVTQIAATLGSQVHVVNAAKKPFTTENQAFTFAVECEQPQEFENVFAQFAPNMGLEARDFLGQRIYSMDPAMMGMVMGDPSAPPMSLGIGGGFIIIGPTSAVEQSLRATSQPGAGGLAEQSEFRRAINLLEGENVVGWGYSDTVTAAEAAVEVQKHQWRSQIEEMRQWDPEFADEMEAESRSMMAFFDKIDWNLLRRHIGPSSWQAQTTPDGFVLYGYQLSAEPGQN